MYLNSGKISFYLQSWSPTPEDRVQGPVGL